jgi:hypothetical protein
MSDSETSISSDLEFMIEQVQVAHELIEVKDERIEALEARIQALEAQIAADSKVTHILSETDVTETRKPLGSLRPFQLEDNAPHTEMKDAKDCCFSEEFASMERPPPMWIRAIPAWAQPLSPSSSQSLVPEWAQPLTASSPEWAQPLTSSSSECAQPLSHSSSLVLEGTQPSNLSSSFRANLSQDFACPANSSETREADIPDADGGTEEFATADDVENVCKKSDELIKALSMVTAECGTEVQHQWSALMREVGLYKDRLALVEQLVARRADQLGSGAGAELRLCRSIKGLCAGGSREPVRRWRVA